MQEKLSGEFYLSVKCARKVCAQSVCAKCVREMCPQNVPAKCARKTRADVRKCAQSVRAKYVRPRFFLGGNIEVLPDTLFSSKLSVNQCEPTQ